MKKPPRTHEFLRQAHQERGWTPYGLARELDVQKQTVRSWERRMRFPSLDLLLYFVLSFFTVFDIIVDKKGVP